MDILIHSHQGEICVNISCLKHIRSLSCYNTYCVLVLTPTAHWVYRHTFTTCLSWMTHAALHLRRSLANDNK